MAARFQSAEDSSGFRIPLATLHKALKTRHRERGRPLAPSDFQPRLKTELLVLQATPFCNVDCDYCYLPQRNSTARMDCETVRMAARRLRQDGLLGEEITVIWHAGEPLTMPREFYEEAFAALDDELGAECKIRHSFQTNATLIDDAWCAFFNAYDVRVGVSVDGPAQIHDAHRKTRSGKGTHARAMRGIECLKRHQIPFHVIAVVTAQSLACADAIFDFFLELGAFEIGLNFDEAEGSHTVSTMHGRESDHSRFLSAMLDRSIATGGRISIREFADAFRRVRHPLPAFTYKGQRFPDNGQTRPFAIVSVAWNGDFSTFSPELLGQKSAAYHDFVLGNVWNVSYLGATTSQLFESLHNEILMGAALCRKICEYFPFCGAGAPGNKFFENGSFSTAETLYCSVTVKHPFDAVLEKLETALNLVEGCADAPLSEAVAPLSHLVKGLGLTSRHIDLSGV
jgi:uncharacterized protein